jgi:hypothetical protein
MTIGGKRYMALELSMDALKKEIERLLDSRETAKAALAELTK